jgi:1-aminocyclopropane-1-carboxylate deaminase
MANVWLLRLDLADVHAPGNKRFKLSKYLEMAQTQDLGCLLSFGGAWSNHLHALAALGKEHGFRAVGIVRGERAPELTATLREAESWGMELVYVTRHEYRQRHDASYGEALQARFSPCLLIPEGGASVEGLLGARDIARLLPASPDRHRLVLAVGTGTTLAGLAAGLDQGWQITGISALKGALDLEQRVTGLLREAGLQASCPWQINHDFHCGGFARSHAELQAFMLAFERVHAVQLEPVYTGKALFAIHSMLKSGQWAADEKITLIHTGGLQGRRGFPWLPT